MRYELHYWPTIQGRGEFVRLALEEAAADYIDVAREDEENGTQAMLNLLGDRHVPMPPFAPPFLKTGERIIGQTSNILLFLGPRHGLVLVVESLRLWAHQLQLTIADLVTEAHDTHHPIASGLYYEDQKAEARRRAKDFTKTRLPKFLDYFERVLGQNPEGGKHMVGKTLTYADLSMFQVLAGLRYAFPHAMKKLSAHHPRLLELHENVMQRPHNTTKKQTKQHKPNNQKKKNQHNQEQDLDR